MTCNVRKKEGNLKLEKEHVASFFFRLITLLMMTKVNPICYAAVSGAHSTQRLLGLRNSDEKVPQLAFIRSDKHNSTILMLLNSKEEPLQFPFKVIWVIDISN